MDANRGGMVETSAGDVGWLKILVVDRDLPTNSVVEPAEGDARMVEGWDGAADR